MRSPRNGVASDPAAWALVALAIVATLLRLWRARSADWYWDEGYLAELALDLGHFQRPHSGALWFNGVLPLTTSWLAPLSAAPCTWIFPRNALAAVRLWAALLGGVSTTLLGLAGRRLEGWTLGLSAAGLFAVGPFAVAFGGMGLYHHLSCALALGALWSSLPNPAGERPCPSWTPWLLAGLSAAACYWLWWVPLALCFSPAKLRSLPWPLFVALGFGPLALVLGWSLVLGRIDAWRMWKGMLAFNYMAHYLEDLSKFPTFFPVPWKAAFGPFCSMIAEFLKWYPAVWLGIGGLFLVGRRAIWVWLGPVLGLADLLRQRGNLEGCPYDFVPLLPWICLGLALAANRAAAGFPRHRRTALGAALVGALALLTPCHLEWIERLSVPPIWERNLQAFLWAQKCRNETVVAEPNIEWRLRQVCKPVEFSQASAAQGWSGGLLPAGLSRAAFVYDPHLDAARFLVTSPEDFALIFAAPHFALEALAAEYEGWPLVFANPAFRVYANPRFGALRNPATRILGDPVLYRKTATAARAVGRNDWAVFALARAASAGPPGKP